METKIEYRETNHCTIASATKRYQAVEQLEKILSLIAVCQSRINYEWNYCVNLYGVHENGSPKCNQKNIDYCNRYRAIQTRLKRYYNFKISQLKQF